jgi:RNA polymerase sigma factor for flagellar operon FliA
METRNPGVSGETLLLAALPVVDGVVAFVCRRHHCAPDDREDFAGLVHLRLIEDDYAVLRAFAGRSSLRTYLGTVVHRLFLDFRRSRWGIWRPCAEARRIGPEAVRLDVLLHRDGMPVDEAIERMRRNEGVRTSESELRALADRLPQRQRRPRRVEGHDAIDEPPVSGAHAVELPALAGEREARVASLRLALHAAIAALPCEDGLALRLRFFERFSVRQVAEWLGCPVKPLYRRMEKLLLSLRESLERAGFRADELGDLLGDAAFETDLETWPAKETA